MASVDGGLPPPAPPAAPPPPGRRKQDEDRRRVMRLLAHASECAAPPGSCPVHGAACVRARSLIAHLHVCGREACTAAPAGHWTRLFSMASAHWTQCRTPDGALCRMPGCDAARLRLAAVRKALEPLRFHLEGITDDTVCRHDPLPFARLAVEPCGPHLELISAETRVRLARAPVAHSAPLLAFLEGRAPLPGLSAAIDAAAVSAGAAAPRAAALLRTADTLPAGVCPPLALVGLRQCAYVADGEYGAVGTSLSRLAAGEDEDGDAAVRERDDVGFSADAHDCCVAKRVCASLADALSLSDARSYEDACERAGAARAAAAEPACVRGVADAGEMYMQCAEAQYAAARALTAMCEATTHADVALATAAEAVPSAPLAPMHAAIVEWVLPALSHLERGTHLAVHKEAGKHGASRAASTAHALRAAYLGVIAVAACTPARRRAALAGGAGRAALEVMQECTRVAPPGVQHCAGARCDNSRGAGALTRQLARAHEAVNGTPAGREFLSALAAVMTRHANAPSVQRWACVYVLLPLARAEVGAARVTAAAAARAAGAISAAQAEAENDKATCRGPCCAADGPGAPRTIAALAVAGVLAPLTEAIRRPRARRAACALVAWLTQSNAAAAAALAAAAPGLVAASRAAVEASRGAARAAARDAAAPGGAPRRRAGRGGRGGGRGSARARGGAAASRDYDEDDEDGAGGGKDKKASSAACAPGGGCESQCSDGSDDDAAGGSLSYAEAACAALGGDAPSAPPPPHLSPAQRAAAAAAARAGAGGAGGDTEAERAAKAAAAMEALLAEEEAEAAAKGGSNGGGGGKKGGGKGKGGGAAAKQGAAAAASAAAGADADAEDEGPAQAEEVDVATLAAATAAMSLSSSRAAAANRKRRAASASGGPAAPAAAGAAPPVPPAGATVLGVPAAGGAAAAAAHGGCADACCAPGAMPFSLTRRAARAPPARAAPPPDASAEAEADAEAAAAPDAGGDALLVALFPHLFTPTAAAAAASPARPSPARSSPPQRERERGDGGATGADADADGDGDEDAHSDASTVELTPQLGGLLPPDAPHEDDALCVCCLDAARDTPLAACAAVHAPVLCGPCAGRVARLGAAPCCPWCGARIAAGEIAAAAAAAVGAAA
jgi:hypothetical protein